MTHLSSGNYSDQQKSPDNGHTRDIMQLQHAAPERRATVLVFSMLAVLRPQEQTDWLVAMGAHWNFTVSVLWRV